MEAFGYSTIVKVGTHDMAPLVTTGGACPEWSGKNAFSLSAQDIADITSFCMVDSYRRGVEEVALAENPFDRVFMNGIPAMIYATYYGRGLDAARSGTWIDVRHLFSGGDHELSLQS